MILFLQKLYEYVILQFYNLRKTASQKLQNLTI